MKLKTCILFMVITTALPAQNSNTLDEKWVDTQILQRQQFIDKGNKNDIRITDEKLLEVISQSTFSSGEEKLAKYLFSVIILDKKYNNVNNSAMALELLITKISDPKYFLKYAGDIARFEIASNPFIIKKLLKGYTRFLADHPDDVFLSFEFTYRNLKYFLYNRGAYGADYVIPDFFLFLREYIRLTGEKKIEDKQHKRIISIGEDMGLQKKGPNDFSRYAGFEELKQDFFYFNNQKSER